MKVKRSPRQLTNVHQSANQCDFRERYVVNIHKPYLCHSRIRWQNSSWARGSVPARQTCRSVSPLHSNLPDLHLEEIPTPSVSFRSLLSKKMGDIRLPRHMFLWCVSAIYMFAFASLYVQIPGEFVKIYSLTCMHCWTNLEFICDACNRCLLGIHF